MILVFAWKLKLHYIFVQTCTSQQTFLLVYFWQIKMVHFLPKNVYNIGHIFVCKWSVRNVSRLLLLYLGLKRLVSRSSIWHRQTKTHFSKFQTCTKTNRHLEILSVLVFSFSIFNISIWTWSRSIVDADGPHQGVVFEEISV